MCHFNVNKELNLGQFPTCDNLIKKIVEKWSIVKSLSNQCLTSVSSRETLRRNRISHGGHKMTSQA
jgi:hypothetical protein